MACRLVSLATAAMGVLMLARDADAFYNVNQFIGQHESKFTETSQQDNLLGASKVQVLAASPVQEFFYDEAVVDHNAPPAQQTLWKQRYLVNDAFWGGKGFPVFFYNGAQTRLRNGPLGTGSNANQLAQKHKALLVGLEHRYYGDSLPVADLSLENLRFLTSEQQLADVARFHAYLTKKMGLETSKWIAFGGSYGGDLAAWEKLKYPTLFAGAVASSAPLQFKSNFFEYNEVVGRSLRFFGGDECYNRIQQGVVAFRRLVDGGSATQSQLQQLFPMCNPIKNDLDLSIYESQISYVIQNVVQYNDVSSFQVTDLCTYFANTTQTPLELLSQFTIDNLSGPCIDSTFEGNADGAIEFYKNATLAGKSNARQWFYQTCNEFGWFQTTTSPNSPFYALKSQTEAAVGLEVCKRVFNISPRITNTAYGGLGLSVENVTFTTGSIDPWSALSVTNTTHLKSSSSSAVYIVGTSHTADIYAPGQGDIPALTAAYAKIAANVAKYLGA